MSTSDFYNIDFTAHYFIPLEKIETVVSFGGSAFSISGGDMALVECTISEGMYGKVCAVPLGYEDGTCLYRPENYYVSYFDSLLKQGIIIKKETETQHVELVNEWEPLTDNTHLVHSGYVVVG